VYLPDFLNSSSCGASYIVSFANTEHAIHLYLQNSIRLCSSLKRLDGSVISDLPVYSRERWSHNRQAQISLAYPTTARAQTIAARDLTRTLEDHERASCIFLVCLIIPGDVHYARVRSYISPNFG